MVIKMNVPKLRFKGFTEEWQNYKIKDLGKIITGTTPPTSDKENYGESYLWASPIDMGINKYINNTKNKLSEKGFQKIRKIPANSVLITCIGSTIGKTAISKYEMSTNQQINSLICNKQFNYEYCYYCINFNFPKFLSKISFQAVPIISKSEFEKLTLAVTKNMYEQEKIGNMLSLLDKKIELQSKKIEALKLYKKGLLYQEYNKLYNFGNLLELGKLAKIYQPHTISSNLCNNGDFFVFGANGIIGKYSKYNHENVQITISCRGEYAGTVNLTPKKCWINGNSMVINIDNSMIIEKDYLRYILESQNLKYLISGSGQPQIIRSDVMKHKIPIIKYEKQTDFYTKFVLLDKKLNFEYKYLNKLQQLKKGLMQNMFV